MSFCSNRESIGNEKGPSCPEEVNYFPLHTNVKIKIFFFVAFFYLKWKFGNFNDTALRAGRCRYTILLQRRTHRVCWCCGRLPLRALCFDLRIKVVGPRFLQVKKYRRSDFVPRFSNTSFLKIMRGEKIVVPFPPELFHTFVEPRPICMYTLPLHQYRPRLLFRNRTCSVLVISSGCGWTAHYFPRPSRFFGSLIELEVFERFNRQVHLESSKQTNKQKELRNADHRWSKPDNCSQLSSL